MNVRRAFLVHGRTDLGHLIADTELLEEVRRPVVVASAVADFDREIDGWRPAIRRAAKKQFLKLLRDTFSQESLHFLGAESDELEVFDRCFELNEIDCLVIGPDDWRKS